MSEKKEIAKLIDHIEGSITILKEIQNDLDEFMVNDFQKMGKGKIAAVFIANICDIFYTSLETLFVAINQFFGNNLQADRWHSDLLIKMNRKIVGKRAQVISDETYLVLYEFMKFRHFHRNYTKLQYDWDRLDFFIKKIKKTLPQLEKELKVFIDYLKNL